jgi:hypothetical protein
VTNPILKFPINYVVSEIQTEILKKYKNELADFSRHIIKYSDGDISLTDKLTLLPQSLLQEGIIKSVLACLNQPRTYLLSDHEV